MSLSTECTFDRLVFFSVIVMNTCMFFTRAQRNSSIFFFSTALVSIFLFAFLLSLNLSTLSLTLLVLVLLLLRCFTRYAYIRVVI